MRATIEASALVRAISNALMWAGKTSPWDHALYAIHGDRVVIITSDSIAAHEETCLAGVDPPPEFAEYGKVSRKDLEALEKRARASKGEVVLTFISGASLTYRDHVEGEDLVMPDLYRDADIGESFDDSNARILQDLLEDREEDGITHRFMIHPKYLRYFSMTKPGPEYKDAGADWWVYGDAPVFVRIGPYSKTVIQPIRRDVHAKKNGDEVLWKR